MEIEDWSNDLSDLKFPRTLGSPVPSSGYCSNDEMLPKYGTSSISDPCLSDTQPSHNTMLLYKDVSSSNFDDLSELMYGSVTDIPCIFDFGSIDSVDVEMTDTDQPSFGRIGSPPSNRTSILSNILVDQDLDEQKQQIIRNNAKFPKTSMEDNGTHNVNIAMKQRKQLPNGSERQNSKIFLTTVNKEVTAAKNAPKPLERGIKLSKTVSNFQQHVAGWTDIAPCDYNDYVLQIGGQTSNSILFAEEMPTSGNSAVFGHIPYQIRYGCETKTLARTKVGAVATATGSMLRHSASMPSTTLKAAISQNSIKPYHGEKHTSYSSKLEGGSANYASSVSNVNSRAVLAYSALADHIYSQQLLASPPTKVSRKAAGMNHNKNTSILEAFLCSTKPIDPNKGSNAALEDVGLAQLCIKDRSIVMKGHLHKNSLLLEKLLTGELEEADFHRSELEVIKERRQLPLAMPVESPLTDDFGLYTDLCLDDPQSMGIGLMGDDESGLNAVDEMVSIAFINF